MPVAHIHGLDTPAGAYLARLLLARGYVVGGAGDHAALARLGIAEQVTADPGAPDEIYDLRGATATRLVDTARLLATLGTARLFSAAGPDIDEASALIAHARAAGRHAVSGHLLAHDSRLGGDTFVSRIAAAALADADPDTADLAASADIGWTPEYVDAMWRMLQRPPADMVLATGQSLTGAEAATHAFAYFKRPRDFGPGTAGAVGDPEPAAGALGWRAVTWGRDLVRTICEGIAAG